MKIAEARVIPPVYASESSRKGEAGGDYWWNHSPWRNNLPLQFFSQNEKKNGTLFKNSLNQALVSGDFKPSAGLYVAKEQSLRRGRFSNRPIFILSGPKGYNWKGVWGLGERN